MYQPALSKKNIFSDPNISIVFDITKNSIAFGITNKSSGKIKLDWDSCSYVDVQGSAHRVIHSGVRLVDAEKYQAPATIPPAAKINDSIYPSDYMASTDSGWEKLPLFPDDKGLANVLVKGKSFSIFMPLEINGVVKNYNFVFRIEDV